MKALGKVIMNKLTAATNTIMFRFTSWYVLSLIVVIFLIGCCIMGAVSYFLIQDTKKELQAVERKILDASYEKIVDWQEELDELLYPDHANYFVEIKSAEGVTLARSRGWAEVNKNRNNQQVELNWLGPFLWDQTHGLFINDEIVWKQKNGNEGKISIQVQLNNLVRLLWLIVNVISITGLISLVAGSILIYHLTWRNMHPLFAIMVAMRQIGKESNMKQRISVPDSPKELADLARTFNRLLDQLEAHFEREKSFVSNASHELRTPLTAFRGHVKLIKRWGKQNPEVLEQSIAALDQESERMQRLIVQLLTLARTGNIHSEKVKVNLSHTIQDAIRQLWNGDQKISLKESLAKHAFVLGDEEQLRQVAVILLENAIRYTNSGGSIKVRVGKQKDSVYLSVADSGIGIPAEDLDKIFDRFYRVDKARSRETGGTGLGLSIARELVQNHAGRITVDSKLGEGSTFTVFFPVYKSTS